LGRSSRCIAPIFYRRRWRSRTVILARRRFERGTHSRAYADTYYYIYIHTAILYYYNIYEQYIYVRACVRVCVKGRTPTDVAFIIIAAGVKENNPSGKPSTFDYGNTTPPTNLPYIYVCIHVHLLPSQHRRRHRHPFVSAAVASCPHPRGTDRGVFSRVCVGGDGGGLTISPARRTTCV